MNLRSLIDKGQGVGTSRGVMCPNQCRALEYGGKKNVMVLDRELSFHFVNHTNEFHGN